MRSLCWGEILSDRQAPKQSNFLCLDYWAHLVIVISSETKVVIQSPGNVICHRMSNLALSRLDMQVLGVEERWYEICLDRKLWAKKCRQGVNEVVAVWRNNTCAANDE